MSVNVNSTDACDDANKLSLQCLDENMGNKKMCQNEFKNFNRCKGFWSNFMKMRYKLGISPTLPPKEERERILDSRDTGWDINPCDDDMKHYNECLEENHNFGILCLKPMKIYKDCTNFWMKIIDDRFYTGKFPIFPSKEERETILETKK